MFVMGMNVRQAEIAARESPIAKSPAPEGELAAAILERTASYAGPIGTPVGMALWAIQAWYVECCDEVRAEELLERP
jgi:hypothetical protein